MSRPGDKGPYAIGNVEIITWEENISAGIRGERHGSAKLTATQVLEIRACKGKELLRETASRFGVSDVLVGLIQRRKIWRYLRPPRVRLVEKPRLEWTKPEVRLYRVFLNEAARKRLAA